MNNKKAVPKKDCMPSKNAWYSSFPNEFPCEVFMASLLAYASSEKTPFPQKQWDKMFFRRQIQLREQPRILTVFLFTAKKCGHKNRFIKFSKGYYIPYRG